MLDDWFIAILLKNWGMDLWEFTFGVPSQDKAGWGI